MKLLRILTAVALTLGIAYAKGAPSRMRPIKATAPDGKEITVIAVGDEHNHRFVDAASGQTVEWLPEIASPKSTPAMRARAKSPAKVSSFPTLGEKRFLVVLVEFKNKKFKIADPAQYFNRHLNQRGFSEDAAKGCVAEYYEDCSDGKFRPVFDVAGPVTMSHDYAYYGSSSSDDSPAMKMVVEAVTALDSQIDFSTYDLNADGYVDNVYFYYAGLGQADGGDSQTIWPHSWDLESKSMQVTLDGVTVNAYACSPELDGSSKPNGIGTFCHEFGHVLGLPDLYASAYSNALHPAEWSLMASGNYVDDGRTPPGLSSYERYELGWVEPNILSYPLSVTLEPLGSPDFDNERDYRCCRIDTERVNEYFLLENRQQSGWDSYLPGHGMLVWHIDYNPNIWDRNVVNNTASHQYVDIVEANNATSHSQDAGFPFPGTSKATSFTAETRPALRSWSGMAIDVPLTEITEHGSLITFDALGGKTPVGAVANAEVTAVGADFISLKWDAATAAERYTVSVDGNMYASVTETNVTISGLLPQTTYNVTIEGVDAYESGRSAMLTVTTGSATFEFMSPNNLKVTDITSSSAVVSWDAIEAEPSADYFIDLSTRIFGDATTMIHSFDSRELPQGWTASAFSWYSISGYYGASAPAVALSIPSGQFALPSSPDPVTAVSLFARAVSAEGAFLGISSDAGAGNLGRTDAIGKEGGTYSFSIDAPFAGPALISINSKAGSGKIVVDDVAVTTRPVIDNIVASNLPSETSNSTMLRGLEPNTSYRVTVFARTADGSTSLRSEPLEFVTAGASAVDLIETDTAPASYYRLDGTAVTRPEAPGFYIERRGSSSRKILIR